MISKDKVKKDYFACTCSMTGKRHWLNDIKRLNSTDYVSVKGGSGKVPVVVRNSKGEPSSTYLR
jgi:hypothetical protein